MGNIYKKILMFAQLSLTVGVLYFCWQKKDAKSHLCSRSIYQTQEVLVLKDLEEPRQPKILQATSAEAATPLNKPCLIRKIYATEFVAAPICPPKIGFEKSKRILYHNVPWPITKNDYKKVFTQKEKRAILDKLCHACHAAARQKIRRQKIRRQSLHKIRWQSLHSEPSSSGTQTDV